MNHGLVNAAHEPPLLFFKAGQQSNNLTEALFL